MCRSFSCFDVVRGTPEDVELLELWWEGGDGGRLSASSVVGSDRLPTFSDRKFLPYVDALVKEVFRWHIVVPLGD